MGSFPETYPKCRTSEESLPVEPGKATHVLPPPPWLFAPVSPLSKQLRQRIPGNEVNTKSGEEFISEKQQEQENIQKLSSLHQQSCLCKGKSC